MTKTIKRTKASNGVTLSAGIDTTKRKPATQRNVDKANKAIASTTRKARATRKPADAKATITTSAWAREMERDPKTVRALIRRQLKRGITTWSDLMLPAADGKALSHTFPDNKTTRAKLSKLIAAAE